MKKLFAWIALIALALSSCSFFSSSPFQKYGKVRVQNNRLVSESGEPIQLRGMSLYNVQGFDWLLGPEQIKELIHDWNSDIVRLAMYTDPGIGGYIANRDVVKILDRVVKNLSDAGMYCIVDWHILHDNDPNMYKKEAIEFFTQAAEKYKSMRNVFFEICNEPNGNEVTWAEKIKPYAVDVIKAIRAIDPDRIVLVGTPQWSSQIDTAADDPIADPQTMYVFHFYSGHSGNDLRTRVTAAMKKIPVFCSEWGTTDDSGAGKTFPEEVALWMDFLGKNKISWCNWSLSNMAEGSAAIRIRYALDGKMIDNLTDSGKLVLSYLKK